MNGVYGGDYDYKVSSSGKKNYRVIVEKKREKNLRLFQIWRWQEPVTSN